MSYEARPLSEVMDRLPSDVAERLSFMVNDVLHGKDGVVRTPFLKETEPMEILGDFTEKVFDPATSALNGTLASIEAGQKEKFGPRSIQVPWSDRKDNLLSSWSDKEAPTDFDNPVVVGGRAQLRPCSMPRVYDAMKRTTSSGLPFLRQKGQVLDDNIEIPAEEWPAVLFTRTQEGGRTRPVWGYPMYTLSREGVYFLPFFDLFRNLPYCTAYSGPDAVDEAISKILYTKRSEDVVHSIDLAGFDQSIPPSVIEKVFSFIRELFQAGGSIDEDFGFIADNFINIGLVTPDGIISGPHGIPSGSWFTSVVGSYVHLVVQASIRELVPSRCQVMGDDGVLVLKPSWSKDRIADAYSKFNLTFNEDKSHESENEVIYLQRYYSADYKYDGIYRGVYPVYRALNRLIHMERWTNVESIGGADYFSIRAIAILENCKWHPMHREFVKWVWQNDKYNLEYTHQGLREYIAKFQPKTSTTIKNQYSDDISGIQNFETVKILKTL